MARIERATVYRWEVRDSISPHPRKSGGSPRHQEYLGELPFRL